MQAKVIIETSYNSDSTITADFKVFFDCDTINKIYSVW